MTLSFYQKLCIGLVVALLVVSGLFIHENTQQEKRIAGAEAHGKAQDAIIASKDRVIADAQARIEDRKQKAAEREQEFAKERAKIKDAKTAQAAITAAAPGAAMVNVGRDELPPQITVQLPDSPSYTVMTQDTAVALGRMTVDLKSARDKVETLTGDNTDLRIQLQAAQEARAAAQSKAKEWETTAHGGTRAHRLKSGGKWAAGGAVVALVISNFVIKK